VSRTADEDEPGGRAVASEPDVQPDTEPVRGLGDWRPLAGTERWLWFDQLWQEVCALRARYRLPVRSGWWEDNVQVEALAALASWVERYACGEWDDPPGKLALLYDLERIATLLRDGNDPFHPERDRMAFVRHLVEIGCEHPERGRNPSSAAAGHAGATSQ